MTGWLTASLDTPESLYRVVLALAVEPGIRMRELSELLTELTELAPLDVECGHGVLLLELACTAPTAEVAAWRVHESARLLAHARVEHVLAGAADAPAPEFVLMHDDDIEELAA